MAEYPQPGGVQRSQQKFIVFDNFEKMNTQAQRTGLPNKQLAWLENLQPISENKLQVVPAAAAAAFASIPETINLGFYAFLNGADYAILFTTAGSAWFINFTANTIGQIAPDGTFSQAPDCTVYQGSILLINDIKSGYCAWNTFAFSQAGGMSPNIIIRNGGSGFGSPVPIGFHNTTQGIDVAGATAVAIPTNGVLTSVILQTPGTGINPGDTISHFITGGAGSGATFTVNKSTSSLAAVTIADSGWWPPGFGPGPGTYALVISGGGGTLAAATATVGLTPGGNNQVVSTTVTNAGSGYTSKPSIIWNNTTFPITGANSTIPLFSPNMNPVNVTTVTVTAGGTGYAASSTLNLTFSSGGQAIVSATATVNTNSSGVIVSPVTVTNAGSYKIGANIVAAVAGGGSGEIFSQQPWPTVPAGTTLAVFQGRVWLGGGNLLQWTGTGANAGAPASGVPGPGYDDFQATDASGSLQIVDADLVHAITALRSLNNYLWIVGDQSIKQIGNISVSTTTPSITLFTILTLSSDQGTIWPTSCVSYNRIFFFVNPTGIYGVFGSTVQKVSDDLDGIFKFANFTIKPQGAVVDLNQKHMAVFLLSYNDPLASTRTLLLMFDGKRWWLASQGNTLDTILTFPNPTSDLNTLYGCRTGSDLTQLFAAPGTAVAFKLISAQTHEGNPVQGKRVVRAGFTADAAGAGAVAMTIDADTASMANSWNVSAASLLVGGANDANNTPVGGAGIYLGTTISGTLANFILQNMIIEYQETALWKGA
jgi:hypothetical protein